jgi:hypothetical protein
MAGLAVLIIMEVFEVIKTKKSYKFLYFYSYYSFTIFLGHNIFLVFFIQMLDAYVTIWVAVAVFNIIILFLLRAMHNKLGWKVSVKALVSMVSVFIALKIEKKYYQQVEKVEKEI